MSAVLIHYGEVISFAAGLVFAGVSLVWLYGETLADLRDKLADVEADNEHLTSEVARLRTGTMTPLARRHPSVRGL